MAEVFELRADASLTEWLKDPANKGKIVETRLKASDRVIARVTDGIYRQPSSALRELISNAWDADATTVTILTDAPRFSRIYIRDNGRGMSDQALDKLVHSIGGSAKRRPEGRELGITGADIDRTPGGRLLIGKIGIGLFSVSQLARRFQIITKAAGEPYRLIAEVQLRAYSEDAGENADASEDADEYISGKVFIRRELADDIGAHGTDIILDDVKPRIRDILRSADKWKAVDAAKHAVEIGDTDTAINLRAEPPAFHSGYISDLHLHADSPIVLSKAAKLPWTPDDPPDRRMALLMDAVEAQTSRTERPDLATTLDSYLEMLWTLGLSAPVRYVDVHPFDLTGENGLKLYWITQERGRGLELNLGPKQSVRDAVKLQAPAHPELVADVDPVGGFSVVIDDVELKRPIQFNFHKSERRGLDHPIMFVGRFAPNLHDVSAMQRGGSLDLEGYLFWSGRIVPKENNGVLVRIRGASGALFDPTFFKYQVAEQTRLRQITSELFVRSGMDAALNIDRESFNYAHPHVQLVTLWLHAAIRQVTNRLKDIASTLRTARKEEDSKVQLDAVNTRAAEVWREQKGSFAVPDVVVTKTEEDATRARREGAIAISRELIPILSLKSKDSISREAKAAALIKVLAAFDLLENKSFEDQNLIVDAILAVFLDSET